MANSAPVGRRPQQERTDTLYDVGLELVAEQREISAKRMQKLSLIARLEEGDQIERERARHRVERARTCLREAQAELLEASEDQERQEELSAHLSAVWKEVLELEEEDERVTNEGEREFVATGKASGAAYIHPDLLNAKPMVAAQKRRGQVTGASPAEAQTL